MLIAHLMRDSVSLAWFILSAEAQQSVCDQSGTLAIKSVACLALPFEILAQRQKKNSVESDLCLNV